MADAVVLSKDQLAQLLQQQQQQSSSSAAAGPSDQKHAKGPAGKPKLKTTFRLASSFEPFYTGGSGTGNCTAVLPVPSPFSLAASSSSRKQKQRLEQDGRDLLLITALDDLVVVTSSSTGQILSRISSSGSHDAAFNPDSDDAPPMVEGDGDEIVALSLSNPKVLENNAREEEEGEDEDGTRGLVTIETTLIVATKALFLRFFSIKVTCSTQDVEQAEVEPDQKGAKEAPRKAHISFTATPQCQIARAHESAIVVLSPSSSLSTNDNTLPQHSPGKQQMQLLATGSSDGTVKVWDIVGGYCTHVLKGHGGVVSALAWDVYLPPALQQHSNGGVQGKHKIQEEGRGKRRVHLFTGSVDGRVRWWNLLQDTNTSKMSKQQQQQQKGAAAASTGGIQQKPLQTLGGHVSVVRGLAISRDGRQLVSGSRDRTLGVWKLISRKKGSAAAKESGSLAEDEWKLVETINAGEGIECAGFLPPGCRTGASGKEQGKQLRRNGMDMDEDQDETSSSEEEEEDDVQDLFYTAGSQGSIRIWSFSQTQIVAVEPADLASTRSKKAQSGTADADEDEDETQAIRELHLVRRGGEAAATSSRHLLFTAVRGDQTFVFRSCSTRFRNSSSSNGSSDPADTTLALVKQMVGFNDQVTDVVLLSTLQSQDRSNKEKKSRKLQESHLAIATNSPSVHVYTFSSSQQGSATSDAGEHSVALLKGHSENVLTLDRSCEASVLASGSRDRTCRLWTSVWEEQPNRFSWKCVATAQGHAESVGAIAFARRPLLPTDAASTQSDKLLTASPFVVTASSDRTVKVWDLTVLTSNASQVDGEPVRLKSLTTLKIHDKDINSVDVAPNNALLISGSQDRTAKVFTLSYSPPSKANSNTASASLKLLATCKGHKRGVWCVRFSPVDRAFATASGDRTIKLWSLNDFSCVKTFEGHTNSVLRVDFLTAGMQLLSTGSDGLVKLWNIKDEVCVWTGDGHEEQVWSLAFCKDERKAVTIGADSRIRVWEDRTVEEAEQKQLQKVEEVQQEQEFSNYLVMKDYKNAIHLALQMNHPRRLLQLFSTVAAQRPEGDASQSVGALLESALRGSSARAMMADTVLRQAGVLPTNGIDSSNAASLLNGHGRRGNGESAERQRDQESITGLYAVDRIIATLPALQLVQLLHHVRDWNTSTRTSDIAQTILHAILRLHTAEHLLDAFEQVQNQKQANALPAGKHARVMDAGTLLDSLIPYSERHYNRADRLLTEAAMLDFTLNSMSALFGEDERGEPDGVGRRHVNGSAAANGMAVDEESSNDDTGDEDTDMED